MTASVVTALQVARFLKAQVAVSTFLPSLRVKTLSRHQKQKMQGISVNPEHAAGIIEAIYRGK